jgi:hypothetical protein
MNTFESSSETQFGRKHRALGRTAKTLKQEHKGKYKKAIEIGMWRKKIKREGRPII